MAYWINDEYSVGSVVEPSVLDYHIKPNQVWVTLPSNPSHHQNLRTTQVVRQRSQNKYVRCKTSYNYLRDDRISHGHDAHRAPSPANGTVSSTQPSIIACAAGLLSPAAMCPALTITTFVSTPDLCTYPASSPPSLSRHTARLAAKNPSSPGQASSLTHASTDAGPLCRSYTPWNSSTRVAFCARTASTSPFTLFMMSTLRRWDTVLLHRVHVASGRAPSAAFASAVLRKLSSGRVGYGRVRA